MYVVSLRGYSHDPGANIMVLEGPYKLTIKILELLNKR